VDREGTRTGQGIIRGRAVRVEGLAHHATGIRQVSINGVPAILRRDRSGAIRFSGRLTAAHLEAPAHETEAAAEAGLN
jgi:hypothetical protein